MARVLFAANAAGFIVAMLRADSPAVLAESFALVAVTLEPTLLSTLCVLYAANRQLARLPYPWGCAVVVAIAAGCSAGFAPLASLIMVVPSPWSEARGTINAALLAGMLLAYFNLRDRAFSPALAEARLQALQARIRPHFFFNSLNAVLAMMRRDPRRAEAALEDLADLFRSVLADSRQLVPLADEIALTRQYLALEQLRLGERLGVDWQVAPAAETALVPPMFLQPLVENAVYHGIEPGLDPGVVRIAARADGERLWLELSNPYHPDHQHRQGNRMALANIEERLQLHFDLEASLRTSVDEGRFTIRIEVPVRRAA